MVSSGDRDGISGRVGESPLLGYNTWGRGRHMGRAPQNLHGSQLNSGYIECKWRADPTDPGVADGWLCAELIPELPEGCLVHSSQRAEMSWSVDVQSAFPCCGNTAEAGYFIKKGLGSSRLQQLEV